ncbi:MAG: adenylyltransferase/cytidyltransferase family protein [Candidatus Micrarchaeota archaeon]|nr:adenylyltransferase/cytidyltransferase family protein [Candidatus Micrarchaeota archaeon]
MDAKELYLLTVKENGLSDHEMEELTEQERSLLTRGENSKFWLKREVREKFTVALTGGAFDILHIGHALTLKKAREQADILVVIVSTDERVKEIKKRAPIHEADYRCDMVASMKYVDVAIVGSKDIMESFYRVRPDIVVFGYDQKVMELPVPVKTVHLTEVKVDPKMAKTSRIIKDLGL